MTELITYQFKEIMKGFYDGPHATPPPSDEGPIFLGIKNIKEEGGIDLNEIRHISENDYSKWTKRVTPKEGDIVFSYEATLHRYAMIPSGFRGCLGRRMALIRLNLNIIDNNFLYYYFLSPYWKAFIETVKVAGSTVDRISIIDFPRYRISLPPLPIQKKIASILSAYDELIENNNQRIKLLEEMAEEIYKEWFVRLRYPGHEHTPITDGVPEGWEKKSLRNYIEHYIGGGWGEEIQSSNFSEPAYVVRGTDIPDLKLGKINYELFRYHKKSNIKSRKLEAGDIIFEVSGGTEDQSLGRSAIVTDELLSRLDHPIICASFCKLIRSNKKTLSPYYLYSALQRFLGTGEIKTFQVQSTGISNYQFEDFIDFQKILKPSSEIMERFDKIHQPMLSEIQVLGTKNESLKETRDLLLPRLISGKLSVEHLLEESEPAAIAAETGEDYH